MRVVVVCGPIASGKSTLARAAACAFEAQGLTAAAIDLDVVYELLDGSGAPKFHGPTWSRARRASAALTDALLADGVHAVVVEGDYLDEQERAEFTAALRSPVRPLFVTLVTPIAVALERVARDPTRGLSRDPAFLRHHYDELAALLERVPSTDLVLDTSRLEIDDAANAIVRRASAPRP